MNEEKNFFKTCFNTVAGLEVKNESQAIAREVVLSEIEHLEQQVKKQKEVIDEAINLNEKIKHFVYENLLEKNIIGSKIIYEFVEKQNKILKEVSK